MPRPLARGDAAVPHTTRTAAGSPGAQGERPDCRSSWAVGSERGLRGMQGRSPVVLDLDLLSGMHVGERRPDIRGRLNRLIADLDDHVSGPQAGSVGRAV